MNSVRRSRSRRQTGKIGVAQLPVDRVARRSSWESTTPTVRSSELGSGQVSVAIRLAKLVCERVGANRYISPPGAEEYLDRR